MLRLGSSFNEKVINTIRHPVSIEIDYTLDTDSLCILIPGIKRESLILYK